MSLRSKIWIGILAVLIIAVNGLTAFYLIQRDDPAQEAAAESTGLFGTPSEIVIRKGGKECTLSSEDEAFQKLLEINENRASFAEYFSEITTVDMEDQESLYMEYRYAEPFSVSLPLRLETRTLKTTQICFALSGTDSTCFSIDTNDGKLIVGVLNIDAELIELATELVA